MVSQMRWTDWQRDRQMDWQTEYWLSTDQLLSWLIHDWVTDRLTDQMTGRMTNWPNHQPTDQLTDWLMDGLFNWMIHWLNNRWDLNMKQIWLLLFMYWCKHLIAAPVVLIWLNPDSETFQFRFNVEWIWMILGKFSVSLLLNIWDTK